MEICRAFDIFEFMCLIVIIVIGIVAVLAIAYGLWAEWCHGTLKSRISWIKGRTYTYALTLIASVIIWHFIFIAYDYIKSMFC